MSRQKNNEKLWSLGNWGSRKEKKMGGKKIRYDDGGTTIFAQMEAIFPFNSVLHFLITF